MSRYITGFSLSRNQAEEQQLKAKGFLKQDAKAKQDKFGNAVSVWVKYKQNDEPCITRVQVSYNDEMAQGLEEAGYTKGGTTPEGDATLWSFCGTTEGDVPIVDIGFSVTPEEEAELIKNGFEKFYWNLLEGSGLSLYMWVKREKPTYIQSVTATSSYDKDVDLFKAGYIRIDEPTNTISGGLRGSNFLWFRLTTDPSKAITDLKISTNTEEYQEYQEQGFQLVDVNLNKGAEGREVYLWFCTKEGKPVKNMNLFFNKSSIPVFKESGIQVIEKNINQGSEGDRFLCFLQ